MQAILTPTFEIQLNKYVPDIKDKVVVPTFQREQSPDRIRSIGAFIEEEFNKNLIPILGMLELCNLDERYYIIDGQHRWEALKNHYELTKLMIPFPIILYQVYTVEEMKRIFEIRNKNVPVPNYILNAQEGKLELLKASATWLRGVNKIFVDYALNRPTIRIADLLEKFRKSKYYSDISTMEQFIAHINEMNVKACDYCRKSMKTLKITDPMWEKATNAGVYLGLDRNMSYYD